MKKSVLVFLMFCVNAIVFAQGFTVKQFHADIYLNTEGYFDIVEKYEIEFTEPKHGIIREIQTDYKIEFLDGKTENRKLLIENIDVPEHLWTVNSSLGQRMNKKISIKIGDKNQFVFGAQHYEIKYRVYNAFLFDDGFAQFYWNVKPEDWEARFEQVSFTVHAPEGVLLSADNSFVYAGRPGLTNPSLDFDYSYLDNSFSAQSRAGFLSEKGQYVTVLLKLPSDSIQNTIVGPSLWKRYGWIVILISFPFALWLIRRIVRWEKKVVLITSYYPPEGMDPGMAGYLVDNRADFQDIVCFLPKWASDGLIQIEEIPKSDRSLQADLKLTKLKDIPEVVPGYEYNFFKKVFAFSKDSVMVRSLSGVLTEPTELLRLAAKKKYYKPRRFLWVYWTLGILSWVWAFGSITFLPFFLMNKVDTYQIDVDSVAFILGVVLNFLFFFLVFPIYIFSLRTRPKNKEGKAIMGELLGFKQFIKIAEINQIKALLKDDPNYFEKTMSYAVAFGMLKTWAAKFESLNINPPEWYRSSTGSFRSMSNFSSSLNNSMSLARTSMVIRTASSSSSGRSSSSRMGGGSSGGGGGRGGGRSW